MELSNDECLSFVHKRFKQKYNTDNFHLIVERYKNIVPFAPDGNIFESNQNIDDELLFFTRLVTQYYLTKAFQAMHIDMSDPNVMENLNEGNIGTAGRLAKIFCGNGINDDRELGSGRFSKKPRMAKFPNTNGSNIPITKKIDIISSCSHHLIAFSSIAKPDSYAVISYIPDKFVLGISKLQRIANWISQRFFLQENLTKALYDEILSEAGTDSVYVGLFNLTHGCETFRGSKSSNGSFTTEYYGGKFKDNPNLIPK